MQRPLLLLLALLALALPAVAACGGGDDDDDDNDVGDSSENAEEDDDDDSPSVPNIEGGGECEVNVTGDVTVSWKGDGGADAVGTEYWMSDDEIREALEFLATGTEEEQKRQVEEGMAEDPRLYILLLNCTSTEDRGQNITFSPSNEATYADVPFGPGDYVVPVGGVFGGAQDPREFGVLFGVEGDDLWKVSEAGTFRITRWDNKGIAGTFDFKAEEALAEGTPKKIEVEGNFAFDCSFGDNCD